MNLFAFVLSLAARWHGSPAEYSQQEKTPLRWAMQRKWLQSHLSASVALCCAPATSFDFPSGTCPDDATEPQESRKDSMKVQFMSVRLQTAHNDDCVAAPFLPGGLERSIALWQASATRQGPAGCYTMDLCKAPRASQEREGGAHLTN